MMEHPLILSQAHFLATFFEIYFFDQFNWNYQASLYPFPLQVSFRIHEVLGRWIDRSVKLETYSSNPHVYFEGLSSNYHNIFIISFIYTF
jgi:hypothetical protein